MCTSVRTSPKYNYIPSMELLYQHISEKLAKTNLYEHRRVTKVQAETSEEIVCQVPQNEHIL
ncbi:hypothetical protein NDU88_006757, partial [Pleurodeles waltl]